MSDVFISYARSTAKQAQQVAETLRGLGYSVWIDDDLPAHRTYSRVIEEQMTAAKAAVVIWSADAVQSEWVMSEANRAREDHKLVQVITDTARLPMPFDTIQCADLTGWSGDTEAQGWRKVVNSVAAVLGVAAPAPAAIGEAPLPLPSKPSIAVMPLANLSGDPEQEYFADGMVTEITNALSRFKSLFVIASSSALSFKGKAVGAQDAAKQLGVRYVLEGSVRKAGDRVRITAQLIDAADGAQIWTQRFEDTLDDVFALQDRVALAVGGKIEPTVQSAEIRRALMRPTENLGSYDLYLRALPLYRSVERTEVLEALDLLNRAITLDPDYGVALGVAAICHQFIYSNEWSDDSEGNRRQGIDLAHRALKAAGDDAHVLAYGGYAIAGLERDLDTAIALFDRATSLNSGSSLAWMLSGFVRLRAGQTDLGIEHVETASRLDPMGPNQAARTLFMALARFEQHRFIEAVALLKDYHHQRNSHFGYAMLAACYGHLGQTDAALAALGQYRSLTPLPVEHVVRGFLFDPSDQTLLLDGVALAEGTSLPPPSA